MGGKRGGTGERSENSKKALGQARKADAAATKQAARQREADELEAREWAKGEKDTSKKAAAQAKAADAARRKAERDALEAAEAASLTTKAKAGNARTAQKKTRGLDLALLGDDLPAPAAARASSLNATGIDNALDALSLATAAGPVETVDRHPERRVKAAFAVFEARRLEEMKEDKGLRRNQKVELIRREFERSPENPMNQVSAKYNSTKDEVKEIREMERDKVEKRLVGTGST